jgi:hypothetical protein
MLDVYALTPVSLIGGGSIPAEAHKPENRGRFDFVYRVAKVSKIHVEQAEADEMVAKDPEIRRALPAGILDGRLDLPVDDNFLRDL